MKQDKNAPKTVKKYQKVWKKYANHHSTNDFTLSKVFDIYLPFWQCKQQVIIEKDIELDKFSRVILQLINQGLNTHSDLCNFLGFNEDSFAIVQFHFLLKNGLIDEPQTSVYEITHEGLQFLKNKSKIKKTETIDFEYFVTEKLHYLKNDLTQDFFDPNNPIDLELSDTLRKTFSGYKVLQSHRINKNNKEARKIPHKDENRPTFSKISSNRNDFASFFNQKFKSGVFYDFADSKIKAHYNAICFLGLLYEQEETGEHLLDIRQSPKSIHAFSGKHILEKVLTEKATQFISKNNLSAL